MDKGLFTGGGRSQNSCIRNPSLTQMVTPEAAIWNFVQFADTQQVLESLLCSSAPQSVLPQQLFNISQSWRQASHEPHSLPGRMF